MSQADSNDLPVGSHIEWPIFIMTASFIIAFCVWALADIDSLSAAVDWGFLRRRDSSDSTGSFCCWVPS